MKKYSQISESESDSDSPFDSYDEQKLEKMLRKFDNHQLNAILKVAEYLNKLETEKDKQKATLATILFCQDGSIAESEEPETPTTTPKGEQEKNETNTVEIDCPPGTPRPDDLFPDVIKGTGLAVEDFDLVSKVFGNFTWELKAQKNDLYKKAKNTIGERIKALYSQGKIRYGSW
jgi:hypothetical protein